MNNKPSNIVIAVATHKPYEMPEDACYLPLHVGADLKPDVCKDIQQDNIGENISSKNAFYSELTGLYWMWKNCNAEYKGLVHYRRHFKSPKPQQATTGLQGVADESDYLKLFDDGVQAVLPKKRNYYIETIEQHYRHTLPEEQLDTAKKVVAEVSPECLSAFESVLSGKKAHMFNMFVMQRDCFDAYCDWLFNVLFKLEEELDPSKYDAFHARYLGRISERLLDAWLMTNNIKYSELKTLSPERVNWIKKGTSFLTAKFFGKKYNKSF